MCQSFVVQPDDIGEGFFHSDLKHNWKGAKSKILVVQLRILCQTMWRTNQVRNFVLYLYTKTQTHVDWSLGALLALNDSIKRSDFKRETELRWPRCLWASVKKLKTKVQIFFDAVVFLLITLYGSFCQRTEHHAKASCHLASYVKWHCPRIAI